MRKRAAGLLVRPSSLLAPLSLAAWPVMRFWFWGYNYIGRGAFCVIQAILRGFSFALILIFPPSSADALINGHVVGGRLRFRRDVVQARARGLGFLYRDPLAYCTNDWYVAAVGGRLNLSPHMLGNFGAAVVLRYDDAHSFYLRAFGVDSVP